MGIKEKKLVVNAVLKDLEKIKDEARRRLNTNRYALQKLGEENSVLKKKLSMIIEIENNLRRIND